MIAKRTFDVYTIQFAGSCLYPPITLLGDIDRDPFAYYLLLGMEKNELAGLFIIHAQKPYVIAAEDEVRNAYEQTTNGTIGYWSEPQYFTVNGTSYFAFHEGKLLSDVDVANGGITYRVQGTLPLSELEKVAESLR